MPKTLLFTFIILFLAACTDTPPTGTPANKPQADSLPAATDTVINSQPRSIAPPTLQIMRGMYKQGTKGNSFYDCTTGKTYHVNAHTPALDSMYRQACQPAPYENESVYAVLRGYITPQPAGASAETNDGGLSITGIDTMSGKTMFNTCLAYDFWCMGTEPFWGLLISEKEAGLFLKNIGDERGRVFSWATPKIKGDTWTYATTDLRTKEKVNVIVRKSPCSDGMSDRQYNYTVEIRIGEQMLRGCAVRYGERVARE